MKTHVQKRMGANPLVVVLVSGSHNHAQRSSSKAVKHPGWFIRELERDVSPTRINPIDQNLMVSIEQLRARST